MPRSLDLVKDDRSLTAGRGVRGVGVDEYEVEEISSDVLANHPQVIVNTVAVRLARLRGEVADVKLQRRRCLDGLDHSLDQEIRKDRRVEGSWANDDELCVEDCLRRFRVDLH